MIKPDYLKKEDTIAIVAPAGKVDKEKVLNAKKTFEHKGYKVILGKHLFDNVGVFSAKDEHRIADLQEATDNPEIQAIICARGGYGTARIIEKINFDKFKKQPKWFTGFSDITVLHSKLNKLGYCSIHGEMPVRFPESPKQNDNTLSLFNILEGKLPKYNLTGSKLNIPGKISGQLIGGNLSILYSLRGTPLDINPEGKILFIEELNEYDYHIDRILTNFELSNIFSELEGVIVGTFSDMKEGNTPFGLSPYEIIADFCKKHNTPVCFNFPAGHTNKNLSLMLGNTITANIGTEITEIYYR